MIAFGNKWRIQGAKYWDAMDARCAGCPVVDLLAAEALKVHSVIEIGCGAGHNASGLFDAGFIGRYWGCDISKQAILAARQRLGGKAQLRVGRFEDLSDAGHVPHADLAIARSVIQHQPHWLPFAQAALRHAPRALFAVIRDVYFKSYGEHETSRRGSFYDVRLSLDAMHREADHAGLSFSFETIDGPLGAEVLISVS